MKSYKLNVMRSIPILLLTFILSSCGNGNGPQTQEEVNNAINSGEYVKLNKSTSNQITRGKDIFNTVMKKYQPVIDFYGADSEAFQKMVNTYLMVNAEEVSSPTDNMYNYDSMKLWEDTLIIVEYEDGTRESLPADVIIDKDGGLLTSLKDKKKNNRLLCAAGAGQ